MKVLRVQDKADYRNIRLLKVECYMLSVVFHFVSPLVTKPLWISKEPFVLHRSSENDRGLEKEP